jgi:hypothetical protein
MHREEITRTHDNLMDVSLFDMPIKKVINPPITLPDENGVQTPTLMNDQVIVYRPDTMEILGRSRSNKYKIIEPSVLFQKHAEKVMEQPDLPKNVIVTDSIFEGGRKQKRTVEYPDLTHVMPDNSKVNMRSDIFNSVDMSWMYQAFAGAYRDLCRNSLVFGGQRMYHVKQKHTTGLNVSATLNQVTKTIQMFNENKELMDKMIKQEVTLEQVAYILAQNIAKKKSGLSRYGIQQKVEVNKKLLDYFLYQFDKEKGNLGSTVWNLFNALTHWSTHIDDTFERENEKTGEIKQVSMTRIGSKTHTAQVKREDKVREFMNTEDWQNMLAGVFIIPKGANLQF